MRKNPPNFRRDVKHLWKNYQKGKVSLSEIRDWFEERGIICPFTWVKDILESNIPSRIFSRLGRAALKKGQLVQIYDIVTVFKCKSNKRLLELCGNNYADYNKIPFYTPALQEETTYRMIYTKEV